MTQFGSNTQLGSNVQVGVDSNFNPLWLPDCVLWFDMQDPRSFTVSSGAVSDITNKASGVVWSQATAGSRPTYSGTGLNNYPCMDFDGVNDIIMSSVGTDATLIAALQNSPALTVFGAVQTDVTDQSVEFFSAGTTLASGSGASRGWGTFTDGTGNWINIAFNDAATAAHVKSAAANATTAPTIYEYFGDGSVGSIKINGAAADPSAAAQAIGTTTPNRCGLGGWAIQTPAAFWDGRIGEILVFSRELTAYERGLVRIYLLRKWGIADPTPLTLITSTSVTQWIRADLGITLATGVSAWNDQSGNGHHFAQATGSQQPAYSAADATLNNRPTVTGDGSNDTLTNGTITNGPGAWQSGIVKMNSWGNFKVVWGGPAGGASNDANDFLSQGTTPQLSMYSGASANFNTALAVGVWGRAEMHWNGAFSYLKLRSTTVSGGNPSSNSSTGCALFTSIGIGFGNYSIAERVVCGAKPTADEIANLDAYYTLGYGPSLV